MKKKLLHHTFRVTRLAVLIAIAAVAIAALAIQYRNHLANDWQEHITLPAALVHKAGDRILVFAPHSDDETLGCGGMIATSLANGADVRVVLVTNGDGFRIAVGRAYKTLRVTPEECIAFAYKRQRETINALAKLGLNSNRVTFLGYPDRGTEQLWSRYWDPGNLYKSRATASDHSPYANSFTPHAAYCGESLLSDLEKVIRQTKPTDIYLPHACDNHPDHYATYCFVAAAVEQLKAEADKKIVHSCKPENRCEQSSFAKGIRMHTYLVHRGEWPTLQGDHPNAILAPPYALTKGVTHWTSLTLSPEIAARKREAIRDYRTQTAIERGFLMSFARRNEIFGDLPVRRVAQVPLESITIDGIADDWPNVPPALVNPVGDYVMSGLYRGGAVRAIYMASDKENLYIRVDFVRHLSKRITYNVNLRGLGDRDASDRYSISIHLPSKATPPGTLWAARNNILEIAIPLQKLQPDHDLFVQVQTKTLDLTVDNTGWREVGFGR